MAVKKGDLIRLNEKAFSNQQYVRVHGALWVAESINTFPQGMVFARSLATGHAGFFTNDHFEEAPDDTD